MRDDILVSIICNTYNHGKYIGQALDSFVMQKTDFKFEILVHDDASTDNTADVISEYAKKYPDLIFPVFQTENQYLKGVKVAPTYQYPRARGKYFALCEGDDYWITDNKLQKQIDYMESHPNCSLCICNAKVVDTNGNFLKNKNPVEQDRVVSTEEVILGGGGFCATNSIVSTAKLFLNRPDYFKILSTDMVLQMYLASCGETYCFAEQMVAYRFGVEGSWTQRMWQDKRKYIKHVENTLLVREAFDEYNNFKYHSAVEEANIKTKFMFYRIMGNYKELKDKCYKPLYKKLPFKEKVLYNFKKYFPKLYKLRFGD